MAPVARSELYKTDIKNYSLRFIFHVRGGIKCQSEKS